MKPYVITLMGPFGQGKVTPKRVSQLQEMVQADGWEPGAVDWLGKGDACDIALHCDGTAPDAQWANHAAHSIGGVDVVVQPDNEHRKKQLLLCDMDSTMIEQECIDELADFAGIKDKVAAITERAMRGELDFEAALNERVRLLKGLPVAKLEEAYATKITFTPGGRELIGTMRARGARCILVSGGFTFFTGRVRDALGFHQDKANLLEVENEKLTGKVIYPILGSAAKLQTLREAMFKQDIPKEDVLAVGDGANDLPMLQAAGIGVAFHAKPIVREQASACLNVMDLRGVLYLQGYRQSEFSN